MPHEAVIGLEVHAQLSTKTKIFCACPTTFGCPPNTNTCPVCLGLPGALPVLNKQAVEFGIMLGLALNCQIQHTSIWDRKNYFYQDLPKGYQITQYAKPYALAGHLLIASGDRQKKIRINRIHLEEDAGKSLHDHAESAFSCVDLNRAGVPLCEIVTEPDFATPQEAAQFLKDLRAILRYTGSCDGNMEEGSLRCDANVSVRPVGQATLGTKVELKNLNSIKFVEKALHYEIDRQLAMLSAGHTIIQETRLFDPDKGITQPMRSKEEAHDYRYFPDPDLVPLIIDNTWITKCLSLLPELPEARCLRFVTQYQLSAYDAGVLTSDRDLADYYEQTLQQGSHSKKTANWILTELLGRLNSEGKTISACPVSPANLAQLLILIDKGTLSGKLAKEVFLEMVQTEKAPETIVAAKGLEQVSDSGTIEKVIAEILVNNPKQVVEYRSGKEKVFGFFVGQIMRAMQGKGNPQMVSDLLRSQLDNFKL